MFLSHIPIFVQVIFLCAFSVPIILIAKIIGNNVQAKLRAKFFYGTIAFYFIYLIIVSVAAYSGLFEALMLPPKIVLLTTIPLAIFYTLFVFKTDIYQKVLSSVELSDLVQLHIFRLIGSIFIILMMYETLPVFFGLMAGIGDILSALGSLFVAHSIRLQKKYAIKLTKFWNTFGLIDIIATSAAAIIYTKISIDTGIMGVEILAQFPFCFIPAFAPATIICLHLTVYKKLSHRN